MLPRKGNSNFHGARPVHLIITMIKWIRTSRLSIKKTLSARHHASGMPAGHTHKTRQHILAVLGGAVSDERGTPAPIPAAPAMPPRRSCNARSTNAYSYWTKPPPPLRPTPLLANFDHSLVQNPSKNAEVSAVVQKAPGSACEWST